MTKQILFALLVIISFLIYPNMVLGSVHGIESVSTLFVKSTKSSFDLKSLDWRNEIIAELLNYDSPSELSQTTWKFEKQEKIKNVSIPILMYHHFTEKELELTNAVVLGKEFAEQMQYLKDAGFVTITVHDLLGFMNRKKSLPKKPIIITMDDGYESNYTYAYPILKRLDMKGTIFVIGNIMRKNKFELSVGYSPKLTWSQAKEMYESGVVEIQNHTYDLHRKGITVENTGKGIIRGPIIKNGKLETIQEAEQRVRMDLIRNKKMIESNVGNKVVGLAYPYGDYSNSSERIAKETGNQFTFTVQPGVNKQVQVPFLMQRINVPGGIGVAEFRDLLGMYLN